VALVASEFPDVAEVAPWLLNEFLGPGKATFFGGSFAVATVFFLVADDGGCDLAAEEVFPANGLLLDGCAVEWMCARESFGVGRIAEPLNETLGDEFVDRLCSVTFVVEVVKCDAKKFFSLCSSRGVGAVKETSVPLRDSFAVRALVVLEGVVPVCFVSCWQPLNGVFDELLTLFVGLVIEQQFVAQGPRD
jgi:hypothetical protein